MVFDLLVLNREGYIFEGLLNNSLYVVRGPSSGSIVFSSSSEFSKEYIRNRWEGTYINSVIFENITINDKIMKMVESCDIDTFKLAQALLIKELDLKNY